MLLALARNLINKVFIYSFSGHAPSTIFHQRSYPSEYHRSKRQAAAMSAARLGRLGLWGTSSTCPRTYLRQNFTRQSQRQRRPASYQSFPGRGPRQHKYDSRSRSSNRVQYLWENYRTAIATVGVGGGVVYVYNLEPVPITGRRRFNVISANIENQIMGEGYPQLLRDLRGRILPAEHPYTVMVAKVVERLLPSIQGLAGDEWKVHVIDDPKQMNAFVMPGGKVFVFSGLFPICHDEDGLAVVLGHEIAHNVAHHAAERLSRSIFLLPFIFAASMLFDVSGGTISFFTDLIFSLPNSRTHEAEADHIGLLMMAESCYNPEAAMQFWVRMELAQKAQQAQQGARPQLLSTHPSDSSRIRAITDWLPEAKDKYLASGCGSTSSYAQKFGEAFGKQRAISRQLPGVYQLPPRPQEDDDDLW